MGKSVVVKNEVQVKIILIYRQFDSQFPLSSNTNKG